MSENVTHVAVCDDVARLARHHPAITDAFKQVFRDHLDIARLGSATRSADRWSAELIAWARDNWPAAGSPGGNGKPKDSEEGGLAGTTERKLAFVLGALTHRAADRLFKPIFEYCRQQYGPETGIECSIHCDVYVFHKVYGAGEGGAQALPNGAGLPTSLENPYQRAVFGAQNGEAARRVEEYLRVLWQRALIGMHTFSPDATDMHGWLDRMFKSAQAFSISLEQYRQVVEGGLQTEKFTRYVHQTHSYEDQDPLIQLARRIQRGETPAAGEVESALAATDERSSRYARALKKGMQYLLGGAQLWRREIDAAQAKTTFDVGVPERSLTFSPEPVPAGA